MIQLEGGELWRNWHRVIHQGGREQLAVLVVLHAFPHGLPYALRNTSMDLPLHDQRVELATAVVNCHKTCHRGLASILIYLNSTDVRAKREDAGLWLEEGSCLQSWLNPWGQRIREVGGGGHIVEGNSLLG